VIVDGQLRVAPNAAVVVQSRLPATQTDSSAAKGPAGGGL
jgi:hypothetical protein